jgi:predicted DNA-binding protein
MSIPLVDFRGKITPEADAALEAMSRNSGRDKSEIVREILHGWAIEKINEARLLDKALTVAGFEGIVVERRVRSK